VPVRLARISYFLQQLKRGSCKHRIDYDSPVLGFNVPASAIHSRIASARAHKLAYTCHASGQEAEAEGEYHISCSSYREAVVSTELFAAASF
jgi:hypothetical protein